MTSPTSIFSSSGGAVSSVPVTVSSTPQPTMKSASSTSTLVSSQTSLSSSTLASSGTPTPNSAPTLSSSPDTAVTLPMTSSSDTVTDSTMLTTSSTESPTAITVPLSSSSAAPTSPSSESDTNSTTVSATNSTISAVPSTPSTISTNSVSDSATSTASANSVGHFATSTASTTSADDSTTLTTPADSTTSPDTSFTLDSTTTISPTLTTPADSTSSVSLTGSSSNIVTSSDSITIPISTSTDSTSLTRSPSSVATSSDLIATSVPTLTNLSNTSSLTATSTGGLASASVIPATNGLVVSTSALTTFNRTSTILNDTISLVTVTTILPSFVVIDPALSDTVDSSVADLTTTPEIVEAIMTATPSARTTSGVSILTQLTTEFTTSTLPNGEMTTIPTFTSTVVSTVLPTGHIEPNPLLRDKGIVGVIVGGVVIVVAIIAALIFAMRKRRKRSRWRSKSPETPYTERSGRVLIRGHSLGNVSHPLATLEWQPPLVSEIEREEGEQREDEEDMAFYSGYQNPVILAAMPQERYSSIESAIESAIHRKSADDEGSTPVSVTPRPSDDAQAGPLISFDEENTPTNHGFVRVDDLTTDPFADPELEPPTTSTDNDAKNVPRSGISSPQLVSPVRPSSSSLNPEPPDDRPTHGLAGITMNSLASQVNPYATFDSPSTSRSSLLNPPLRPQFTGTLTDLVLSSGSPVLPPILPVASPAESVDSYHPEGLLDPALLESRSFVGDEGVRSKSSESLADYVDYSRPISSIVFRPPTAELHMEGVEEGEDEGDGLPTSPAVWTYHNRLLGSGRDS
ncbi:hypothetical protein BDP27DRAFT_1309940 [Rhodocollybia butyracea]|uniref:Uncharacterized protein n=1 Tax=Rhodocollybia butyracea TaxID=206335 RepID=A0A9P5UGQ2_9AGAR|nr:hypothetical protein BDP27DRAFT_1309940 [Rhodocollybia butyracea]